MGDGGQHQHARAQYLDFIVQYTSRSVRKKHLPATVYQLLASRARTEGWHEYRATLDGLAERAVDITTAAVREALQRVIATLRAGQYTFPDDARARSGGPPDYDAVMPEDNVDELGRSRGYLPFHAQRERAIADAILARRDTTGTRTARDDLPLRSA